MPKKKPGKNRVSDADCQKQISYSCSTLKKKHNYKKKILFLCTFTGPLPHCLTPRSLTGNLIMNGLGKNCSWIYTFFQSFSNSLFDHF